MFIYVQSVVSHQMIISAKFAVFTLLNIMIFLYTETLSLEKFFPLWLLLHFEN